MRRKIIRYATQSSYKQEEMEALASMTVNGKAVSDLFEFQYFGAKLEEPLERNLAAMVRHKVKSAYRYVMQPCIAEHAGIILQQFEDKSFPGGLTQPMWDAVGPENFVRSLAWADNRVIARAVVGYCDGMRTHVFFGDTIGSLAASPRGSRAFYWDTIFVPDDSGGRTYAEISDAEGLIGKMQFSQSTKAMMKLFEFLLGENNELFG